MFSNEIIKLHWFFILCFLMFLKKRGERKMSWYISFVIHLFWYWTRCFFLFFYFLWKMIFCIVPVLAERRWNIVIRCKNKHTYYVDSIFYGFELVFERWNWTRYSLLGALWDGNLFSSHIWTVKNSNDMIFTSSFSKCVFF